MEERRPSKPEILRAATASRWVKRGTADSLEISRSTLYRWINAYGIDWEAKRAHFEKSRADIEANKTRCERNASADRIDRIDRIADSAAPLASGSGRPRFEPMQQSTSQGSKRRSFEVKLRPDAVDWIRHRAIDKGVPAYQVVEELVEQAIQRERGVAPPAPEGLTR